MLHGGDGLCSVHYRRKLAYRGELQGWVAADKSRKHLKKLEARGVRTSRVAELAEMNHDSLRKIVNGKRQRIRALTEQRILAIGVAQVADIDVVDHALKPIVGSSRRLQSLVRLGYGIQVLANRLGMSREGVDGILYGRRTMVRESTARDIRRLFDELQLTTPPDGAYTRSAIARGEKNGWPLPLEWDEDEIDNPTAQARCAKSAVDAGDRMATYLDARAQGISDRQIAKSMGIDSSSLSRWLQRERKKGNLAA